MQAEIEYGDIRIPVTPIFHKEKYTCTVGVDVELPAQVRIHYSGKNSGADTLIDSNGNIVQDLCVKITNMKLDGFPMSQDYMYKKLLMTTETGEEFTTCYAGFNGFMTINLTEPTVFSQYVLMNS